MTSDELEDADDPRALGRRPEQVRDLELRLAEEDVGAFLLEDDDRAQQDAHGRARHPAVVGQDRLALVGRQELERRARSLRSSSGRSLSSQYLKTRARIDVWVSLRSRTLPSSNGPKEWTVARTWAPSLPDSDRYSTGWPEASNVQPSEVTRSTTFGLVASPGAASPVRSPLMSATKTGTPAFESWPARSWSVLVLPVPVAPAIRPCRLSIDSATWTRASLASSVPSIGLPMMRPGSVSA